eukprot:gb/GECH01013112.1/.p1 GENE.gb/GECH01013112.1/~~gb/GECH01013112.1/.p1  ORF type:complete len:446 (+),score=19.61 gb/GECH01013112.1/:1-1338(+)
MRHIVYVVFGFAFGIIFYYFLLTIASQRNQQEERSKLYFKSSTIVSNPSFHDKHLNDNHSSVSCNSTIKTRRWPASPNKLCTFTQAAVEFGHHKKFAVHLNGFPPNEREERYWSYTGPNVGGWRDPLFTLVHNSTKRCTRRAKGPVYFVTMSSWYHNIFHFVLDSTIPLFHTLMINGNIGKATLVVVGKKHPNFHFLLDILAQEVFYSPDLVSRNEVLCAEHLHPTNELYTQSCSRVGRWDAPSMCGRVFRAFRNHVITHLLYKTPQPSHELTITFLTRSKKRHILNRNALIETMQTEAKPFNATVQIVGFEKKSLQQQIKTMATSDVLVSVHGAGMTNEIWIPDHGSVMCIYPYACNNQVYNMIPEVMGLGSYTHWANPEEEKMSAKLLSFLEAHGWPDHSYFNTPACPGFARYDNLELDTERFSTKFRLMLKDAVSRKLRRSS